LLFGGSFFLQPDRLCFFQSLGEKNKKQKFVLRNPGDTMGVSGFGSFICLWAVCARSNRWRALIGSWVTPHTTGSIEIERGGAKNIIINHGSGGGDCGRRRSWPLLPPIGPPRPFRSRSCVDRAMVDAPYRRPHQNLAGVNVLPNNPPWRFLQNNSSSPRRRGKTQSMRSTGEIRTADVFVPQQ